MQRVFALVRNLCVDGLDALLFMGTLRHTSLGRAAAYRAFGQNQSSERFKAPGQEGPDQVLPHGCELPALVPCFFLRYPNAY